MVNQCRNCKQYFDEDMLTTSIHVEQDNITGELIFASKLDRCIHCDDIIKDKLLYSEVEF